MKILYCREVCDKNCDFIVTGDSERRLVLNMFFHGESHHKDKLRDMNDVCRKRIAIKMHAMIKSE